VVFGAVKMEDVIYKSNGICVFWVLIIVIHPATNPPMIPTHYPHDTRHTLKQTYITRDT